MVPVPQLPPAARLIPQRSPGRGGWAYVVQRTLFVSVVLTVLLMTACSREPELEIPEVGESPRPWLAENDMSSGGPSRPRPAGRPAAGELVAGELAAGESATGESAAGESPAAESALGGKPASLLLITLDTTRRDRLGCYGATRSLTPHLDRLAREGVLFEKMVTPVPITLPAHATIHTGRNPPEHGIRHNGLYRLPEEEETLAELLAREGYETGAIIAATPLERRYGLDQGFATYDDALAEGANEDAPGALGEWAAVERSAEEVTQRALSWLNGIDRGPYFLWVHYFDPHAPYAPPEPYREAFAEPYDGEIAYMDEQIGILMRGVTTTHARDDLWIAIMADHGEALGAHGEATHGMLLHEVTLGVPCLLIPPRGDGGAPFASWHGRRVGQVCSLRDVAPTLVNALGLEPDALPCSGRSLLPLIAGETSAQQVVYTETLAPFLDYGWSALRGLRWDDWSYVKSPVLELYNLAKDPVQEHNLSLDFAERVPRLDQWVDHYAASEKGTLGERPSDGPNQDQLARLMSLGYLSAGRPTGPAFNPKAPQLRMHLVDEIHAAQVDLSSDPAGAAQRLRRVLEEDPENPAAWRLLGLSQLRRGLWEPATESFQTVLARVPQDAEARLDLAWAMVMSGRPREAEDRLRELLADLHAEDPRRNRARGLLTGVYLLTDRGSEARRMLTEATRETGESDVAAAYAQLAQFEWQVNRHGPALDTAREALAHDSTEAAAWAIVGEGHWLDARRAIEASEQAAAVEAMKRCEHAMRTALRWDRNEPVAAFRMAFLSQQKGHPEEAITFYRRVLARRPDHAIAHVNLGHLLRQSGQPGQARSHYASAHRLGHEDVRFLMAYGDLLHELDEPGEAEQIWQRAVQVNSDPAALKPLYERLESVATR